MSGIAQADYGLNLPVGVTETSKQVHDLHMLILWVCVAIGVVVFGAMIYSMIYHRKSRGAVASQFHESMAAELVWTIIPFIILIVMAIPATKVLIEMHDTSEADMKIKVTGYQWKWRYEYVGEGVDFFSTLDVASNEARQVGSEIDPATVENYLLNVDNPLVLPVGKKVSFLLTASDVIHSWWVPDFGWKKDAIPGYINEAWVVVDKPGIYRGQCAELCGRDHGFMPIVVEVKSEEDYAAWLAEQKSGVKGAKIAALDALNPRDLKDN
jgi:cytochrome c oxidase subunit 2